MACLIGPRVPSIVFQALGFRLQLHLPVVCLCPAPHARTALAVFPKADRGRVVVHLSSAGRVKTMSVGSLPCSPSSSGDMCKDRVRTGVACLALGLAGLRNTQTGRTPFGFVFMGGLCVESNLDCSSRCNCRADLWRWGMIPIIIIEGIVMSVICILCSDNCVNLLFSLSALLALLCYRYDVFLHVPSSSSSSSNSSSNSSFASSRMTTNTPRPSLLASEVVRAWSLGSPSILPLASSPRNSIYPAGEQKD